MTAVDRENVVAVSRLEGRVCVVNGAASVLGQAVADRFIREGGTVVGVDVLKHGLGDLALQVDLIDESQVESMYGQVVERFGRLDVIYNNTGLMDRRDQSALLTDLDTWRRVQDANLTSVFLSCKHGIPHLQQTVPAGGSVINAASFLANTGAATAQMSYAAAKDEAAATIAFLASDESGFITAAAIPLDGGITQAFTVPE